MGFCGEVRLCAKNARSHLRLTARWPVRAASFGRGLKQRSEFTPADARFNPLANKIYNIINLSRLRRDHQHRTTGAFGRFALRMDDATACAVFCCRDV